MTPVGSTRMAKREILELLELNGWSQAELGRRLELHEAAISRWVRGECAPTGPARILMRQWLDEARTKPKKAVAV